eukprot:360398-Chlamydomonas_euryale.AAC.4
MECHASLIVCITRYGERTTRSCRLRMHPHSMRIDHNMRTACSAANDDPPHRRHAQAAFPTHGCMRRLLFLLAPSGELAEWRLAPPSGRAAQEALPDDGILQMVDMTASRPSSRG